MATAKYLDREVSPGERPLRPAVPPAQAPDSPVMPDTPLTPGEAKALEEERDGQDGRVPDGGLPDGIPHGDEGPGAKQRRPGNIASR